MSLAGDLLRGLAACSAIGAASAMACSEPVPARPPVAKATTSAASSAAPPAASSSARRARRILGFTPRPPPPPPYTRPDCALPGPVTPHVRFGALTPSGDVLVVLLSDGCIEAWNVAQRSRVSAASISPALYSFAIVQGPMVVTTDGSAYALPSLARVKRPESVEPPESAEPPIARDEAAVSVRDLDASLLKRLKAWAARSRATVQTSGALTWIKPNLQQGELRSLNLSADGKLLVDNETLVRLDTGKQGRFSAWTKGFTAMSSETFDGTTYISLGPRSDRAVIQSIARMGAGPEIGSAYLVDTTKMKRIAWLETSCQPHDVTWSPRGTLIVRQPCDHGVLSNDLVAVDADTGALKHRLPSGNVSFADDETSVASGGVVLDIATWQPRFTWTPPPPPAPPERAAPRE